jgi:Uma2 family endonuclease
MSTAAVTTRLMSMEEYLGISFEPDADFVDGVIEERNLGEWDHAGLQGILDRMLAAHEEDWNVFVQPELRVRISETRVRIPDVCVTDARNATERVTTKPPLLCVEVKSPKDQLSRMFERIKDFHGMGVGHAWVFDPETRRVWVSTADGVTEWGGGVLNVPGTLIELDPAVAFAKLDRRR